MNDRLCEFRELLHAQRISLKTSITRLAESDVEERLVRAFQSGFRRQPRQLAHQSDEVNCIHLRDKRVALGHVANQRSDLFGLIGDVHAEDVCGTGGRRVKSEQRVNQRRLARAIWSEQTDRFPTQIAAKVFQDCPATESNAEAVEVDHWRLS